MTHYTSETNGTLIYNHMSSFIVFTNTEQNIISEMMSRKLSEEMNFVMKLLLFVTIPIVFSR